jgi:hypothetical protein
MGCRRPPVSCDLRDCDALRERVRQAARATRCMRPDTRRAGKPDKPKANADGTKARDECGRSTALASSPKDGAGGAGTTRTTARANDVAKSAAVLGAPLSGDVIQLAPNIISVKHWDRLLGGLLYAVQPRVDWATLVRRSLSVDVRECPKCHGRLRVVAVINEREPVRRILAHPGMPTDAPPVARARDPTEAEYADELPTQLALDLA